MHEYTKVTRQKARERESGRRGSARARERGRPSRARACRRRRWHRQQGKGGASAQESQGAPGRLAQGMAPCQQAAAPSHPSQSAMPAPELRRRAELRQRPRRHRQDRAHGPGCGSREGLTHKPTLDDDVLFLVEVVASGQVELLGWQGRMRDGETRGGGERQGSRHRRRGATGGERRKQARRQGRRHGGTQDGPRRAASCQAKRQGT
jgi:hypothetical protein